MVVDDVVPAFRPTYYRDHVPPEKSAGFRDVERAPFFAFLFDLAHPDRHLRRPQIGNVNGMQQRRLRVPLWVCHRNHPY
jgi:hypothetical protein